MGSDFGPYAPTGAVVDTITRFRDRGLPSPLNAQALQTIGIAGTMATRTLQALRFLGFLDDDDNPTELFQRIKRAEYRRVQGATSRGHTRCLHPRVLDCGPGRSR